MTWEPPTLRCPRCGETDQVETVQRSPYALHACARCDLSFTGSQSEWFANSTARAERRLELGLDEEPPT